MMDLTPEREHRSYPKGPTQKQIKAKADRAEAKVKRIVRAKVDERDGYCRIESAGYGWAQIDGDDDVRTAESMACEGPSEWCHMHVKRRSQTRGQAPEIRHTTAESFKACQLHHDAYDGRTRPRLIVTSLTRKGANGPMKFTRGKA